MCTRKSYNDRVIVRNRSAKTMTASLESESLYHHGASKRFGADPEFRNQEQSRFPNAYQIKLAFSLP